MEEQGTDAPSSVGDDAPSVGGDDGGGYSDDAAAANQSVTPSYSTAGVGLGRDTYSQVDAMKGALGITPTNPFGYQGFFSKTFGIDPEDIDYTNIFDGNPNPARLLKAPMASDPKGSFGLCAAILPKAVCCPTGLKREPNPLCIPDLG